MIVQCTNCLAKFKFDESKLAGVKTKKVRCSKCKQIFSVMNPDSADQAHEMFEVPKVQPTASRTPTGQMDMAATPPPAKTADPALTPPPPRPTARPVAAGADPLIKPVKKKSVSPSMPGANEPPRKKALSGGMEFKPRAPGAAAPKPPIAETAPQSARSKPHFADLSSVTGGDPNMPSEPPPAPQKRAIDELDPLAPPPPEAKEQKAINHELYHEERMGLELAPQMEELKELRFTRDDGILELEDDRQFLHGSSQVEGRRRKKLRYIQRPLTGERIKGASTPARMPKTITAAVKALLIAAMVALLAVAGYMMERGERFNYRQFDPSALLSGASISFDADTAGASEP